MINTCMATTHDDDYEKFQESIKSNFEAYASTKLFTTNAENLFDLYLKGIPEGSRQHYNCNTCRKFIETYGGLVSISPDGRTTSVLWNKSVTPGFFSESVENLARAVNKAKVTGVFFDDNAIWGTPVTGEWGHIHVQPAKENVFYSKLHTPFQAGAEKKEDFKNVIRALSEFPLDAVTQAVNLLSQDAMNRSEKIIGPAEWMKLLHETIANNKGFKSNIVWVAIASAPSGFCHLRNSMIGTLLEDIIAGMPFDEIKRRFDEKMHPLQYQRPQAAPSVGNIEEAEKIIEKLGIAKSLDRRFAKLNEIEALWNPAEKQEDDVKGGVFGHLKAKNGVKINQVEAPAKTMTWEKFSREILPTAENIEFYIPFATSYSAIITAEHADAPPILQWDREHQRNPFSWYLYSGGSSSRDWGLPGTGFQKVTAICFQPSMWFDENNTHQGSGVMFVLNGAKDLRSANAGNGLFPEILKSDLRGIRSTLESYSRGAKISGLDDASACGLLLQKGRNWDAEFRVTTNGISNKYKLDRWD